MERWRSIKGFDGYKVSSNGRVKNRNGKIMKPYRNKSTGYMMIRLWKDKKHNTKTVHRLVANAFISKDNDDFVVNHIDGDKTNNCIENLEWCSKKDNSRHAIRTGLFTPYQLPPHPNKRIPVRIVETGEEFPSIDECARYVNGYKTAVSACLKGKVKTHMGYNYEKI